MTRFGAYFSPRVALRAHVPRGGWGRVKASPGLCVAVLLLALPGLCPVEGAAGGWGWSPRCCCPAAGVVEPPGATQGCSCCRRSGRSSRGSRRVQIPGRQTLGSSQRCGNCTHAPRARRRLGVKSCTSTGSCHHGWLSSALVALGWELLPASWSRVRGQNAFGWDVGRVHKVQASLGRISLGGWGAVGTWEGYFSFSW